MSKHLTGIRRGVDVSELVRVVPHLAPETLHQLIQHYGIGACAALVAVAAPAQLASVFDIDLWRSARPGLDASFDLERFGDWVELLVDADEALAARTVAAMDEHLVVAGLSRYLRVYDPGALAPIVDGEVVEHEGASSPDPECRVGGYLVRATRNDAWDAIVALLVALDAGHTDRFHALMRACRRLSNSAPEADGLDDLLAAPEQVLHDAAIAREERRSQQGYSTPADARAFLLMARQRRRPSKVEPARNPIAAAYFRAVAQSSRNGDITAATPPGGSSGARDATVEMLLAAGVVSPSPRALLEGTHGEASRTALVRRLLAHAREQDDGAFLARHHELAFLANTLVAGCSVQSRSFTPQEAADAAVATVNLGLEHWAPAPPATFLVEQDLVSVFELGWAVLHEDVSLFAADRLAEALSILRCSDADIQAGLHTLRLELKKQRKAGTPWRARAAADVLAMLDMPAWVSVVGLLDECPVIPAALTATLARQTTAVSPTQFDFISSRSQLGAVREFMAQLIDILGR